MVIRNSQVLPTVSTADEIRTVVSRRPGTLTGRWNRAMLLTMVHTGVRSAECRHLLIESVDWRGPSIHRQASSARTRVPFPAHYLRVDPKAVWPLRSEVASSRVSP